jgi:hypothetical protein
MAVTVLPDVPEAWVVECVERMFGERVVAWRRPAGGYTPALRLVAMFASGKSAFLKVGTTAMTSGWLLTEHAFYREVRAPFVPRLLGWDDGGPAPVLALEDLSGATWPPPWDGRRVRGVLETLAEVARLPLPAHVRTVAETFQGIQGWDLGGWAVVAANPAPFLSLGVCTAEWLDRALPALIAGEVAAEVEGDDLVHMDVRSDNLCFVGNQAVLVDWNLACVGNALFDIAFWLPSLEYEGGPAPEEAYPAANPFAARVAGFFAARAGEPDIPDAPFVRRVQREQLSTALPWAVRVLELPELDGRESGGQESR